MKSEQHLEPEIKGASEYGEQAQDYPAHLKQFYNTLVAICGLFHRKFAAALFII